MPLGPADGWRPRVAPKERLLHQSRLFFPAVSCSSPSRTSPDLRLYIRQECCGMLERPSAQQEILLEQVDTQLLKYRRFGRQKASRYATGAISATRFRIWTSSRARGGKGKLVRWARRRRCGCAVGEWVLREGGRLQNQWFGNCTRDRG